MNIEKHLKHYPFNPTPEQRTNLLALADYLESGSLNLEFSMNIFQGGEGGGMYATECGTVGCAIGHGPSIGIVARKGELWHLYANRVFGNEISWMFSENWALVDNTPRGAAARIRYALKHGIPENDLDQSCGKASLSYTIPNKEEKIEITY